MSSSRSVASARARRAGGESSGARQGQMRPGIQSTSMDPNGSQSQGVSKETSSDGSRLSVSDAFALVTIRLGRVEMALQKLDIHSIAKDVEEGETSGSLASNVMMKSIVSRIDDLETSMNKNLSESGISSEHTEKTEQIEKNVQLIESELRDAKDAIYKLQNFALDVNEKIGKLQKMYEEQSIAGSHQKNYVEDVEEVEDVKDAQGEREEDEDVEDHNVVKVVGNTEDSDKQSSDGSVEKDANQDSEGIVSDEDE